MFPVDEEMLALAREYVAQGIIPTEFEDDAIHVAVII
jgi:hypothetical protein